MAHAVHVPRVNNNDDEVKLVGIDIPVGGKVARGQIIGQVETDKAVVDIEADVDGFVLALTAEVDTIVQVGSVLAWIGATADEAPPQQQAATTAAATTTAPTAKAAALLVQHGLDAAQVPARGERLSVADIEHFLSTRTATPSNAQRAAPKARAIPTAERAPDESGNAIALTSEERGMLVTVQWHRDVAVPGYIEIPYDAAPWDARANAFQKQHGLLLNPVLSLMAWRLVELAAELPRLNATIANGRRHEYHKVNLGFTVQAGAVLYLTVTHDAAALGELGFVNALFDLQRRAAAHHLRAAEVSGTTIGFSSMARWKVARHIPILSPQTALMVAHAVAADGSGVLGAAYDHRVLNGADVATTLRKLSKPKSEARVDSAAERTMSPQ